MPLQILRIFRRPIRLKILGGCDTDPRQCPKRMCFHVFHKVFAVSHPQIDPLPERVVRAVCQPDIDPEPGAAFREPDDQRREQRDTGRRGYRDRKALIPGLFRRHRIRLVKA